MMDAINAIFEIVGAILAWVSVLKLAKAKQVRGVYWPMWAFFAVWGYWNLFFYSQFPLSQAAGAVLAAGNSAWVALAIRYRRN